MAKGSKVQGITFQLSLPGIILSCVSCGIVSLVSTILSVTKSQEEALLLTGRKKDVQSWMIILYFNVNKYLLMENCIIIKIRSTQTHI